jgi:type 1 fimbria pilin
MKTLGFALAASILLCGLALAAPQKNGTFSGEIMDSACAKMGSHDAMMKQHPNMKTAKDCTLGCVKAGSKFVLYDSSTKNVYEIDDQKKAEQFAGQKVTITGNLDAASNTLHVTNIKTGSAAY